MNKRVRSILATVLPAAVGGGIFIALLPWGDPCSFNAPDVHCAPISSSEEHLRNAVFVLLNLVVGGAAALSARSWRTIAAPASAVLAALLTHFGARALYDALEVQPVDWTGMSKFLAIVAILGLIGGLLSIGTRAVVPRVFGRQSER
jgi:hypothetical protein